MNKIIASLIVVLTITSLCALTVPTVSAEPSDITILNYTWYIAPSNTYYVRAGDLVVVGEVQNTGSSVVDFVALQGVAYTTDGEAQAGAYTSAYVENFLPQQKAPFYMVFSVESTLYGNLTWLPLLDRVDLRVIRADTTDVRQYPDLAIVANTSYVDTSGAYTIVGYLQNAGAQQSGKVWVVGTFYDSSGATIATGFTNFLANYTEPNQSIQFALTPRDSTAQLSAQITSYSLLIQNYEPEPTPTPTASVSPTTSPTSSPSTTDQTTASPQPQQTSSSTLVTAVAATAVVVVVIVVVLMLLKKKQTPKP